MAESEFKRSASAILIAGIVAGSIDVGCAALINHAGPTRILQVIASGLIGRAALSAGNGSVVLGLILQWLMSIIIATIYVVSARYKAAFLQRWVVAGFLYGTLVFVVMNFVVIPLSAMPFHSRHTLQGITLNLAAMWLFGLIIAFFGRRMLIR
jgi:uncharacterized membrane protein YagU involved in acid resistance